MEEHGLAMETNITKIGPPEKNNLGYKLHRNLIITAALFIILLIILGGFIITENITSNLECVEDNNNLTTAGQTALQHLSICRQTVFCINDWNSCPVKENISDYAALCLTTDQNLLNIYKVFERN